MAEQYKDFLFEYDYEGATWCITIKARDQADAPLRMQRMSLARYCGEVVLSGKVLPDWLSRWFGYGA